MIFEKIKEELQEKIKVTNLEIIVTGTEEKPYFEIKYKEVGKEDYNIGYSSYDLNNVFNWKEECFEIVNQVETEYNNGWIPCSERLPEKGGSYIVCSENQSVYVAHFYKNSVVPHWSRGKLIAWQPLPEPYTPKGE